MGTTFVEEPISIQALRDAGEELFGDMVKAVVDVEKKVMAIGGSFMLTKKPFCSNEINGKRTCGGLICIRTAGGPKWSSLIP